MIDLEMLFWTVSAVSLLLALWIKAFLETYFWDNVMRQWLKDNWGDWHYAKFFFWGFLCMATRWLIPPGLLYDAALLLMQ